MLPDYGALPPEINSGRMYAGPGSAPLLAAAAAWAALATETASAVAGCESIAADLGATWRGPSAQALTAAATRYLTWLRESAAVAEHAAGQAQAAAAAHQAAFAATVPPPVIAANRALLAALVATNFFGQNTPAIAAAETAYALMWAQDAVAMYGYAATSAAASRLTPLRPPPPVVTPNAVAAIPQAVAAPTATTPLSPATAFTTAFSATKVVNTVMSTTSSAVSGRGILITDERLDFNTAHTAPTGVLAGLTAPPPAHTCVTTAPTGTVGRATLVGRLSVPPGWTTAAGQGQPAALTTSATASLSPETNAGPPTGNTGMFSQSLLGTLSREEPQQRRHSSRPVIVRSPAAG